MSAESQHEFQLESSFVSRIFAV